MAEIELTELIHIDRPAAEVWAVVADYRRDTEWRAAVRAMVPQPAGPVRVGTTTAEELRIGGRTTHNDGVVTEVEPGVRFSWRTVRGAAAHGAREVTAVGPDRCRVRLDLVVRPSSSMERLLLPVFRLMLRRTLEGDLRRLRTLVEEAAPARLPH